MLQELMFQRFLRNLNVNGTGAVIASPGDVPALQPCSTSVSKVFEALVQGLGVLVSGFPVPWRKAQCAWC